MRPLVSSMDGHSSVQPVIPCLFSKKVLNFAGLLLHLDLTGDGLYEYFIDNQGVAHHRSLVTGLRELSDAEMHQFCSKPATMTSLPLRFDTPMAFSANYELRTYTSGCYYLDSKSIWQSDGLVVS